MLLSIENIIITKGDLMMNRKTIMFLALLGTYAAQAGELIVEEGYFPEYATTSGRARPSATQSSRETFTYGGIESSAQKQARIEEMAALGGAGEQNYPLVEYQAPERRQNYPLVEYQAPERRLEVAERRVAEYKPKVTSAKKTEKATKIEESLKNAEKEGGSEMLCSVAARFGRSLKVLPKSKGPISRTKLATKCSTYFKENGHPQALAAVNS
jgi:hypothetical protein